MSGLLRNSGIPPLGEIRWGTHFCHFFEKTEDLLEVVVPYFAAGLEQKELCFWLVAAPLTEESAKDALRRAVPDFDQHDANGAIFFRPTPEWLLRAGRLEIPALVTAWTDLVDESQKRGYVGLRAAGCQTWLHRAQWKEFHDYERELEAAVSGKPMLVLCSYPLSTTDAAAILDVADSHELAVAKREGKWDVVETPELRLKQLDLRNRQQIAISALGLTAIRERNIGVLFNQAASLAATTLGTDRSIVWQLRPEQDDLILRAKFGWDELPSVTTIPLDEGTAARHGIYNDQPVFITDIPGDERFSKKSWILRDYHVNTMISAVIRGHQQPWGALSVHSLTPRSFTEDDVAFMQSMANVLALAIERDAHEAAERHEKEILQTIFDNLPVMIAFFDASGKIVSANPEWRRALGWTAEEAMQMDIMAEVFPDPFRRECVREFMSKPNRGWRDFQLHTRDGNILESTWARFALSDRSSIWLAFDVTERKRAEERFREVAENIDESFWIISGDLEHILYLNPAGERLLGGSLQSLSEPRSWLRPVHPDDRDRVWNAVSSAANVIAEDFRIVRPDGSIRWVSTHGSVIRDSSGNALRVCGFAQDITERKEAENERARLLASQTDARALAESALAKLHAIESITDTALGRMALDELLTELLARLRRALGADYAGVHLLNEQRTGFTMRAGDGMDMSNAAAIRVPLDSPLSGRVLKEGRALILNDVPAAVSAEWHRIFASIGVSPSSAMGAPLVVEGKVIGVVTISSRANRQFTEEELDLLRVVADRAAPAIERSRLMESVRAARERLETLSRRLLTVQEEERRRVAIELHDELGQVLTAVKIGLQSMPAQLNESIHSVDRAMETVRDLALDLRPAMLDDLGLAAALRWYADRFAQQNHVEMRIAIEEVPQLDPGLATTSFRVAQEALTNIARHAAAKNVWLELHRTSSELELAIRDDGIGFDVDAARERAARGASLGLLGMEERVSLAGGSIVISSTPAKGTEVRARFPLGGAQ